MNTINISEHFYSVQCEGKTTGVPAYFIRLMNCNLSCGASRKMVRDMMTGKTEHQAGDFVGDLHEEGLATWTCDTLPVWIKGNELNFQEIVDNWEKEGIKEWIEEGRVNLIWTGGEPTLNGNQQSIINFINWYRKEHKADVEFYNEIETNGTGYIEDEFFKEITQINCSVKLANSGMSKDRRIVPKSLERIMSHYNYWFKFVVSTEEDILEIQRDFIEPFNIPWDRIILMPGLDDQKDFHERTRFSLEMAKKYGYIGLTRLHVSAWDRTTGV